MKEKKMTQKGITLIALIVTIIVLLILAGVNLRLIAGGDGIMNRASNAVNKTDEAKVAEEVELAMAQLQMEYYQARYAEGSTSDSYAKYAKEQLESASGVKTTSGKLTLSGTTVSYVPDGESTALATGTFNTSTGEVSIAGTTTGGGTPQDPTPQTEEISIGASVTYTPTGTYNWDKSLADTDFENETEAANKIQVLDSSSNDFKITSWKVLSVSNGTVTLVPSAPTTGTLTLQGYQGYNNAVKLLNDACSGLYDGDGEGTKITARSVSMEDIEPLLDTTALGTAKTNSSYDITNAKGPYTEANSHYPSIYATEEKTTTSGMSSQNSFITTNGKVDGTSAAGTLLSPYNTYYYMDASTFSGALGTKSSLFLSATPSETPNYWVASRCVLADSGGCDFRVRGVYSGYLGACNLYYSGDLSGGGAYRLFPVVSLNSELLSGDNTNGYTVKTVE